jgi:LAGLIDADG endonuclease
LFKLLLLLVIYIYKTPLDSEKSSIRNWILVYINLAKYTVIISITWGQSDWASVNLKKFKIKMQIFSFSSSETKRGAFYSTGIYQKDTKEFFEEWSNQNNLSYLDKNNLHPKYVTGISDAESTFSFTIIKRITNKTGWFIQPIFQIELHNKDALILEKLQSFFGVGNFRIKNIKGKNSVAIFSVVSIKDLINIIIPHFYKYPLLTQKRADFELFKQIVLMMDKKDHLTMEGIKKIISIRASLNKGLSPLLINHFPKLVPCERPQVETPETFDPFWILGFVEGEGCFYVKTKKLANNKLGFTLFFILSQHSRDRKLLISLIKYLGCGRLEETYKIARLVINKFDDIHQILLPFFVKYPLIGLKIKDLNDWCRVVFILIKIRTDLIKKNLHLTKEGMDEINSIKLGMNSKRYLTVNSNNPKLSTLSDETSVDSYNLNSLSDEENSKLNGSTRTK